MSRCKLAIGIDSALIVMLIGYRKISDLSAV